MKILVIGDVVSQPGLNTVNRLLRKVKKKTGADLTIVNGENASGTGITPRQADDIFSSGADVITLGNHALRKQNIAPYLDDNRYILRPANLAPQTPGAGYGIYDAAGWRVLVMSLIGRCDMQYGPDNPFLCADRILRQEEDRYDVAVCEIHANATSDKLAMGYCLRDAHPCADRRSAHQSEGNGISDGYRHDRTQMVGARYPGRTVDCDVPRRSDPSV